MIIAFVVELISIEDLDLFLDHWLNCNNFFINFIVNDYFINLFLVEFNHQDSIFIGSFVHKIYSVEVNSFIKRNIFYLSFRFANDVSQLIEMKEKKLELHSLVF